MGNEWDHTGGTQWKKTTTKTSPHSKAPVARLPVAPPRILRNIMHAVAEAIIRRQALRSIPVTLVKPPASVQYQLTPAWRHETSMPSRPALGSPTCSNSPFPTLHGRTRAAHPRAFTMLHVREPTKKERMELHHIRCLVCSNQPEHRAGQSQPSPSASLPNSPLSIAAASHNSIIMSTQLHTQQIYVFRPQIGFGKYAPRPLAPSNST